jgi:hypothetical protein
MYVNFNKEKREYAMKYETPRMSALMPAINAVQTSPGMPKGHYTYQEYIDPIVLNEASASYQDWE